MNHISPFQIGHVLLKVNNLKAAVSHFETLGFCVTYASNPKKATNAMIYFPDGSFLELFCVNFGQPLNSVLKLALKIMTLKKHPYANRYRNYLESLEGLCDYALDTIPTTLFQENMKALEHSGFSLNGPRDMKRKNVEGILLSWSMFWPSNWHLPFFMSPYTPALILDTAKTSHQNGAYGFQQIILTSSTYEETKRNYEVIYQQKPTLMQRNGVVSCQFLVGKTNIIVEQAKNDSIKEVSFYSSERGRKKLEASLCHKASLYMNQE